MGKGINTIVSAGIGAASGMLGMIGQKKREKRALNNQKELMGLQHKNQRNLNQQGHDLGKEMWEHTFMPIDAINEKGMNPALLYGQSGAGGTTSSGQSGGSAASGSAPAPQPMEIGQMTQAAMTAANIELAKSQAEKNRAEASSIKGGEGTIGESTINKANAETKLKG